MTQDYMSIVKANLQRAADMKAAERKEEERATRWAKIAVISLLLIVGAAVVIFGNDVANWC